MITSPLSIPDEASFRTRSSWAELLLQLPGRSFAIESAVAKIVSCVGAAVVVIAHRRARRERSAALPRMQTADLILPDLHPRIISEIDLNAVAISGVLHCP